MPVVFFPGMAGHPCPALRATSLSLQGEPADIVKGCHDLGPPRGSGDLLEVSDGFVPVEPCSQISATITVSGASTRTAGAPASASITAAGANARTVGAPASASIAASGATAATAAAMMMMMSLFVLVRYVP